MKCQADEHYANTTATISSSGNNNNNDTDSDEHNVHSTVFDAHIKRKSFSLSCFQLDGWPLKRKISTQSSNNLLFTKAIYN